MGAGNRFRLFATRGGACALLVGGALFLGAERSAAAATQPNLICEIADVVLPLECETGSRPGQSESSAQGDQGAAPAPDPASLEGPVRHNSPAARYDPRRLGLTVHRAATEQGLEALFARAEVKLERAIPHIRAYIVEVEPGRRQRALRVLRRSPLVASAGREPLLEALAVTPDDEDWPQQWGLRVVGLPQAWAVTQGSKQVIVAVLDTGVDSDHADLRKALVPGYDFVNSDSDPTDDHGHGTAVAGIVAARANNRDGIAGVCWNCSIMPVKVLDSAGVGGVSLIAAGIVWAVDHGARVINLSLGGPATLQGLTDAIAYAAGKRVAVVAAAGNDGTNGLVYPAADPLALSVAATTSSDRRYPWSNFGSWVRVAAPGCNIAPLRAGGEGIFCGTSSATPVVAGLVALAYSVNPAASSAEVEHALESSAVPLPATTRYGRVSAPGALALVAPRGPVPGSRAVATLRGRLDPRGLTFPLNAGVGSLRAKLKSFGPATLSLTVFRPEATSPFARAAGRNALQLETTVPAGALRFVIKGSRRATFSLAISYARPGGAAR
jgi:subtilisin family serine protease